MAAVAASATKVVLTVWLLLPVEAVTTDAPAFMLVSVTVTVPSASVVPVAAMAAALSAVKFTVAPATGLPPASLTVALTLLVAVPSALALSLTTTRSPGAIDVLMSRKCTDALEVLSPAETVTDATPATRDLIFSSTYPLPSVSALSVSTEPSAKVTVNVT